LVTEFARLDLAKLLLKKKDMSKLKVLFDIGGDDIK